MSADAPASSVSTAAFTLTVELNESDADGASSAAQQEAAATAAEGQAQWLLTFWAPTLKKKHPDVTVTVIGRSAVQITGIATVAAFAVDSVDATSADHEAAVAAFDAGWRKAVASALKKADVDDLGVMDADALLASIPEDANGRGLQDLRAMEKDLGVKVVFCTNQHVLLVGPKAKLGKKCFVLRNLLSHYHWRLSGRDVAFETMTATR